MSAGHCACCGKDSDDMSRIERLCEACALEYYPEGAKGGIRPNETGNERVLREVWEMTHRLIDRQLVHTPHDWHRGHNAGVIEERERWTKAIEDERLVWFTRGGDFVHMALRNVLIRLGIAQ